MALTPVCVDLRESLLVIRYPGGLLNVFGHRDVQMFSSGLTSVLKNEFTAGALLSGQTLFSKRIKDRN